MTFSLRFKKRFFFYSALTIITIIIFLNDYKMKTQQRRQKYPSLNKTTSTLNKTIRHTAKFAVMTQTEQCIPKHFLHRDYFGNLTGCDCEVYVLSYRDRCMWNPHSHIIYIFNPKAGWSTGRNLAYKRARQSKKDYLYYVFIDDDIVLTHNQFTPVEMLGTAPFQLFTDYLMEHEPAGAATDYQNSNMVAYMVVNWHGVCSNYFLPHGIPLKHADPCFNAFHKNAVDTLLPYAEEFDRKSYWVSGLQLSFMFQHAFYRQYLYYPFIRAMNPKHRYNKIGYVNDEAYRRRIVHNLQTRSPQAFRNHSSFSFMLSFDVYKSNFFWCEKPLPSKTPIFPYKWMHNFTVQDVM